MQEEITGFLAARRVCGNWTSIKTPVVHIRHPTPDRAGAQPGPLRRGLTQSMLHPSLRPPDAGLATTVDTTTGSLSKFLA